MSQHSTNYGLKEASESMCKVRGKVTLLLKLSVKTITPFVFVYESQLVYDIHSMYQGAKQMRRKA